MNNVPDLGDEARRWARFGPYYAMFPVDFAAEMIEEHSNLGERVLDPFAGRGTSAFTAAALGRNSVGVEINPVGWIYGKTKIAPAPQKTVIARLEYLCGEADNFAAEAEKMNDFFRVCFCGEVRRFLLAARKLLNWKRSKADATLMAFIVLHLHGKKGEGMSNQMRQTKAMSPDYSLRWWKAQGMPCPPQIDPREFLLKKIEWRYAKGAPKFGAAASLYLGDSDNKLPEIFRQIISPDDKFSLLFTSPPYCGLVNYHADQWLRLWLLGGNASPRYLREKNRGRFNSPTEYRKMLHSVFSKCAKMMTENCTVYVRTDIREFTCNATREVLKECFPKHRMEEKTSYADNTQSKLFRNTPSVAKPGEVDIILRRQ